MRRLFVRSSLLVLMAVDLCVSHQQFGPDPWDYHENPAPRKLKNSHSTIDLLDSSDSIAKVQTSGNKQGEWFFKRILGMILKGGQVKDNKDGTIDVGLQMQFSKEKLSLLNQYISSSDSFTEDMYRRSVGYVEDAIYKPSIMEKISLAWTEYVHVFISEYKIYLMWILVTLVAIFSFIYLWKRMSHKHIVFTLFVIIYCYEAFVSYKEAEKKEYESFVSALNACKWQFWSSDCNVPAPDPLIFLKHMHPLKIGLKIFSMIFTEPLLVISSIVQTIASDITDGLWFPLNKLVYIGLVITMTIVIIMFVIMVLFNFILNIPFNLSLFAGLINFGVQRRNRTFDTQQYAIQNDVRGDRLSGETLNKFLNVCASAINNTSDSNRNNRLKSMDDGRKTLKKSSSLSRISDFVDGSTPTFAIELRNRKRKFEIGSGDSK